MPGWIAVQPIPQPEDPSDRCASCGEVHRQDAPHQGGLMVLQLGPQGISVADPRKGQGGGHQGQPLRIYRGIVLEIGEHPQIEVPFEVEAVVCFPAGSGVYIGDALFMLAERPVAWED
jgi:hypothetical protein